MRAVNKRITVPALGFIVHFCQAVITDKIIRRNMRLTDIAGYTGQYGKSVKINSGDYLRNRVVRPG